MSLFEHPGERVRPVDLRRDDVLLDYGEPYRVLGRPVTMMSPTTGRSRVVVTTDKGTVSWPAGHASSFPAATIVERGAAS